MIISINAIIFSNDMIREVYRSSMTSYGYPPFGLRIPGPGSVPYGHKLHADPTDTPIRNHLANPTGRQLFVIWDPRI